ncbi:MAG: DNA gyrase inhibitor YacG [Gammaproteobacteria bacterium]|nr:MAG: DNA gyrase inhibitor YacG [Gammaproteobacteria bacterium]RKZ96997.1 MAG: DNA gyrase inhibitor YacG [Gammaproteobacteria bacterium]
MMVKTVNCPQCDKAVPWRDEQAWKPFCSERCKLIDLGDWASESHRIAGDPVLPPENNSNEFH